MHVGSREDTQLLPKGASPPVVVQELNNVDDIADLKGQVTRVLSREVKHSLGTSNDLQVADLRGTRLDRESGASFGQRRSWGLLALLLLCYHRLLVLLLLLLLVRASDGRVHLDLTRH